jgi:hypothetical protein
MLGYWSTSLGRCTRHKALACMFSPLLQPCPNVCHSLPCCQAFCVIVVLINSWSMLTVAATRLPLASNKATIWNPHAITSVATLTTLRWFWLAGPVPAHQEGEPLLAWLVPAWWAGYPSCWAASYPAFWAATTPASSITGSLSWYQPSKQGCTCSPSWYQPSKQVNLLTKLVSLLLFRDNLTKSTLKR